MTSYAFQGHDSTAVVGRRVGAWFIDLGIYLLFVFIVAVAFQGSIVETHDNLGQSGSSFCDQWRADHNGSACAFVNQNGQATAYTVQNGPIYALFGVHFVLYCLIQGAAGASLGKLMVGLRVVTPEGALCGIPRSFARTFLWIVDGITFGFPVVGGVLILSTKGHRRVGDMAAGTYVVDKREVGHPVQVPGVTAPTDAYGSFPAAGGPPPWGAQQQQPWGQPQLGSPSQPAPDAAPSASTDGPRWDPDRNTYIQWDPGSSAWLEWDDTTKQWKTIST